MEITSDDFIKNEKKILEEQQMMQQQQSHQPMQQPEPQTDANGMSPEDMASLEKLLSTINEILLASESTPGEYEKAGLEQMKKFTDKK